MLISSTETVDKAMALDKLIQEKSYCCHLVTKKHVTTTSTRPVAAQFQLLMGNLVCYSHKDLIYHFFLF